MARMKILNAAEQVAFDTPPLFNPLERKQFFEFPKPLLEMAANFRHPVNQVCFLVGCGYFKATKCFFSPTDYHPRDIVYISNQLAVDAISTENYVDRTRQRHQQLILEFYGFSSFDSQSESELVTEIATMARTYLKPKLIFSRCTDFLIQKRIQVPKSWTLTELIRSGLQAHKSSLVTLMNTHLDEQTRCLLDDLFTTPDDQNQYRHFLWHSLMMSASDRESAYVIDGLMHNDVVKNDIHSTDTHGYTEAIFGLTHLLGFSFAPRIQGIGKQTLYIFRSKNKASSDWEINPDKTINANLIRENWDDLLRLVTTIKLKENTTSDIFRRLNSYSRQHVLYQTMKAFGQIIKSLFILRYINDVELRQVLELSLS